MGIETSLEIILAKVTSIENYLQDSKEPQKNSEPSDRCQLKDACEITGLSKASLYKLTHGKKIPHLKFGSRLVFSRRSLAAWVESLTLSPSNPEDEIKANLIKSAEKHLRNAK